MTPPAARLRRLAIVATLACSPAAALHTGQLTRATRASLHAADVQLAAAHGRAQAVPCPFFRRRFTDSVESAQLVIRWVRARHKSLPIDQPASALPCAGAKLEHLGLAQLAAVLQGDFERRAFVSGRHTRAIYLDECVFDGPDPDMPVVGVRKYCLAVSGLFDPASSRCALLGAPAVDEEARTISCHWRLSGRLRLPWKPAFKPYLGRTTYRIDGATGLICSSCEEWSVHPLVAFLSVLAPRAADWLAPDAPDVQTLEQWLDAWPAAAQPAPTRAR